MSLVSSRQPAGCSLFLVSKKSKAFRVVRWVETLPSTIFEFLQRAAILNPSRQGDGPVLQAKVASPPPATAAHLISELLPPAALASPSTRPAFSNPLAPSPTIAKDP
jgi:hypothetical protein